MEKWTRIESMYFPKKHMRIFQPALLGTTRGYCLDGVWSCRNLVTRLEGSPKSERFLSIRVGCIGKEQLRSLFWVVIPESSSYFKSYLPLHSSHKKTAVRKSGINDYHLIHKKTNTKKVGTLIDFLWPNMFVICLVSKFFASKSTSFNYRCLHWKVIWTKTRISNHCLTYK